MLKYQSFPSNWFSLFGFTEAKLQKIHYSHIFWLNCPTDMRSLILSYIFKALFRNTPLAYFSSCHMCHICHVTCDKKGEIKKSQMHKYRFGQSGRKAEHSLIFYVRPHIWCTVGKRTMLGDVVLANTQIQIHKYTNTAMVKIADRHNMCYIFEKVMARGPQKQCSLVSDLQILKYK